MGHKHPADRAQRRMLERRHRYGEQDKEYIRQREELKAKEAGHELAGYSGFYETARGTYREPPEGAVDY